uniref:Odorant receptor n=1 Tax=Culicoides sonorensis TaxID=179676 RepID=A0A336LBN8_CULSO
MFVTGEIKEVFKKIEFASWIVGLDLPLTKRFPNNKKRKFFKLFNTLTLQMYFYVTCMSGVYHNTSNTVGLLFEIGLIGGIVTSASVCYYLEWYKDEYMKIFNWIAEFHQKNYTRNEELYGKAFKKSKNIIKGINGVLITLNAMFVFGCVIQIIMVPIWNENGKFNIQPPFPNHLPEIPVEGWTSFAINVIFQTWAETIQVVAHSLNFTINPVIIIFVTVHMDILANYITRVSENIEFHANNNIKFDAKHDIKQIIERHLEITKYVDKLVQLTGRTFFTLEINTFVYSFFNWMALASDDLADNVQALGGIGGLSLLFYNCIICDILDNANEKFIDKINDIPWYSLTPRDRGAMVLMILKLQRPSEMQIHSIFGPKKVTFENFANTLQSVYQYCLVIEKVMA